FSISRLELLFCYLLFTIKVFSKHSCPKDFDSCLIRRIYMCYK
ncbi:unnamed protein product, partial [Brassica oleracea var. botrytis]